MWAAVICSPAGNPGAAAPCCEAWEHSSDLSCDCTLLTGEEQADSLVRWDTMLSTVGTGGCSVRVKQGYAWGSCTCRYCLGVTASPLHASESTAAMLPQSPAPAHRRTAAICLGIIVRQGLDRRCCSSAFGYFRLLTSGLVILTADPRSEVSEGAEGVSSEHTCGSLACRDIHGRHAAQSVQLWNVLCKRDGFPVNHSRQCEDRTAMQHGKGSARAVLSSKSPPAACPSTGLTPQRP